MFFLLLTALLAAPAATAQSQATTQATVLPEATKPSITAKKPANASPATPKASAGAILPSDPVITIHGACNAEVAKGSGPCKTVVTRQQFDAVMDGLNAIGKPILPIQRRGVAEGYAATLVNYEAALKAGVERDPRFAEVMRLARMRAMGDMYKAMQEEKAMKVSPEEIQAYYKSNTAKFEELTMRRVTLPRFNQANLKDEEFATKARKIADDMHDRMVKGEDLDALQKEAFTTLGVKDPPRTKMGPIRLGLYEAEQEKLLFALKPGEVTAVIEQPSAFIIFKLEGRETPSLEKSKDEIVRILVKQHMEKQEQARSSAVKVEYDEQYVGPPQPSAWMPANQVNASPKDQTGRDSKNSPPKSDQPK